MKQGGLGSLLPAHALSMSTVRTVQGGRAVLCCAVRVRVCVRVRTCECVCVCCVCVWCV